MTRNTPFGYSPDGKFEVTYDTCPDCGEQYADRDSHRRTSERHRAWAKGTAQPEVPVPNQPPAIAYTTMPTKVEFGTSAVCPRCKGLRPTQRADKYGHKPQPLGYTTEKGKKTPCIRCNGFGIVPNQSV